MSRTVIMATIEDAEHFTPERRAEIIASYAPHERDARTKGIPVLGSGRIFPVEESLVAVEPFQMPAYWPKLGAMDFGWDHPFAAVEITFDPDGDVVYVTRCYRARQETPILHAAAVKSWGNWIPWAWPHDGLQHDKGSGEQLAKQYESHGLNMMGHRATFSDGSNGVEAGVIEMLDRMQTGRLKVFSHLNEWFEEFRLYHRKDGKIVKEADDLMCLHGDTLVQTDLGHFRIADLVGTSGRVRTVGGRWTGYSDCRLTRRAAAVVRLDFSDGTTVISTPDHRFLTLDGWVEAFAMQGKSCHTAVSSSGYGRDTCESLFWTRIGRNLTGKSIRASASTIAAAVSFCIVMFGHSTTGRLREASTSIISTMISRITKSRICFPLRAANIFPIITRGIRAGQQPPLKLRSNGARQTRARHSLGGWAYKTLMSCISKTISFVKDAVPAIELNPLALIGSAPVLVRRLGAVRLELMTRTEYAPLVTSRSASTDTKSREPVQGSARALLAEQSGVECLKVSEAGIADVYCMAVPETEAFAVQGDLIVHNCATRYGIMMIRHALLSPSLRSENRKKRDRGMADPLESF